MFHYGRVGLLSSGKYLRPATRTLGHVAAFGGIYPHDFSHEFTCFLEEDLWSGIKIESRIHGSDSGAGCVHRTITVPR